MEGSRILHELKAHGNSLEARVHNPLSVPITVRWWLEAGAEVVQLTPWVTVVPARGQGVVARLQRSSQAGPAQAAFPFRYRYRYALGRPGQHPDGQAYSLPFGPFRKVRVMQGPGGRFSHQGKHAYDFALPLGAWVLAARAGEVVRLNRSALTGGLGPSFLVEAAVNAVQVAHSDGSFGYYAHFMPQGVAVQVGQQVAEGDRLGQAGATGYASGPHLHFELNAAGTEAEVMGFPVRFRTTQAPEGQALKGGEWVAAP